MANSIRTPREGTTDTSRRIARAVDNEAWQMFRLSMKGKPTEHKIRMLEFYFHDGVVKAMNGDKDYIYDDVCVRVDNYIKALCRGGQLDSGLSLEWVLVQEEKFAALLDHVRR